MLNRYYNSPLDLAEHIIRNYAKYGPSDIHKLSEGMSYKQWTRGKEWIKDNPQLYPPFGYDPWRGIYLFAVNESEYALIAFFDAQYTVTRTSRAYKRTKAYERVHGLTPGVAVDMESLREQHRLGRRQLRRWASFINNPWEHSRS